MLEIGERDLAKRGGHRRTPPSSDPRVRAIEVTADLIIAHLADGRTLSVPLAWSWRLAEATPEQRAHYELLGDGTGVHWPEVDEDISVDGMLGGTPARRPSRTKGGNA